MFPVKRCIFLSPMAMGLVLLLAFFMQACMYSSSSKDEAFYFPAQWEEQEAVWLGWAQDTGIQRLQIDMARAVHPHVGITVLARSDSLLKVAFQQLLSAGVEREKVKGYVHFIPNVFIRDAGPRFLKNARGDLAIADLGWNNYGWPAAYDDDQFSKRRGEVDNDLAGQMNLNVFSTGMVAEGGGIEVSSNMMISIKEMALQRNPGKSLAEIEKEYLRLYGKKKIIWLNKMLLMDKVAAGPKVENYFGYGANGHVDEVARFVNDSTIVVATIEPAEKDLDPISRADYAIVEENLEILKNVTDVQGRPFKIVTFPTPAYSHYSVKQILTDSMKAEAEGQFLFKDFKAGDEIVWIRNVSYANFFITNKTVLVARYWQEGMPESERIKDEKARAVLQSLFPDRKIVQLNPMALNRWGGGMNCATQQQPKRQPN